ncbi:hypothetical protein BDP27DRAFT_1331038 [Rhodocollybia butyracea]|uniref:Gelsolin-like domain-containing protein n=1 Tax=Rhodocollybia butyracea TaxID=206335 RepID=A0A9P5U4Q1_9AGAR|nr:hypothetical protein BDP27DRAFT_1331038 [Rhodocollybia butyracea]
MLSEPPPPSFTRIVTSTSESESPVSIKLPKPAPVSRSSSGSSNMGRVTDRWAEQAIIGVKPVGSYSQSSEPEAPKVGGMVGRRALPGLAVTPGTTPGGPSPSRPARAESSERSPASPLNHPASKYPFDQNSPTTPSRHSRIPSTGNRATVMDVAQTFAEPDKTQSPVDEISSSPEPPDEPEPLPPLKHTLRQNVPPPLIERRRSSYNSAVTLPPLQEEATPAQTPSGTLTRGMPVYIQASVPAIHEKLQDVSDQKSKRTASEDSDLVEISHDDPPLPNINIDALLKSHLPSSSRTDLITVSVEVITIFGNSATILSRDIDVFYDEEVLAIVHRSKSKTSGLVSTTVHAWFGKNSKVGEIEQGKLEELSKRYRTPLITVNQYAEPLDMLWILGNKLAVRQGKRTHWSPDNTAMHVVRSKWDTIFIDEIELNVRNLCSGFSYCLTVLETVYVWYGCGSTLSERNAALVYGRSLSQNVVELEESQSRDDEMFWMILGEDTFANANYWQWRSSAADITPRVWEISEQTVKPVNFLSMKDAPMAVYLIDCIWEFFILVGSEARAQRQNIRTALHCASALAKRVCQQRPHDPPIHVVVLPSQMPLDLKMHFRELDESLLNHQVVPEHMNLISLKDAHDHLQRTSWERFSLRDPFMLPLGIQPEML